MAARTLDSVLLESAPERNDLIEELADTTIYSHGVFGCFGRPGHYVQETSGPNPLIASYADGEKEYAELFSRMSRGPEFFARVFGKNARDGFILKLSFNDRQGDHRGNSHTDYTLFIPEPEAERIVPLIKEDPAILIEVFQAVFPRYDRSGGGLGIDAEYVGMIEY